ncbi:MAG: hypothetical protein K8L99_02755 [Anaerolineae bacterium]|nr:hypothetical protein [Anaerolineae bacterium]
MKKILVAYATAYGSTEEVAQEVGRVMRNREFDVTVANVETIDSVEGYDVFVLGSAIQSGMWLTSMSQFLDRYSKQLGNRPVYFFITCIRVLEPDGYQHAVENYVNHEMLNELNVREIKPLAGKLEMSDVDWDDRWTLAARYDGKRPPGSYNNDFRDWNTIREWASQVADHLLPT